VVIGVIVVLLVFVVSVFGMWFGFLDVGNDLVDMMIC